MPFPAEVMKMVYTKDWAFFFCHDDANSLFLDFPDYSIDLASRQAQLCQFDDYAWANILTNFYSSAQSDINWKIWFFSPSSSSGESGCSGWVFGFISIFVTDIRFSEESGGFFLLICLYPSYFLSRLKGFEVLIRFDLMDWLDEEQTDFKRSLFYFWRWKLLLCSLSFLTTPSLLLKGTSNSF